MKYVIASIMRNRANARGKAKATENKHDLAISTSWNAHRFNDGAGLLFEINQLKFKAIELSFNLSAGMVDSIAKESRRLGINIQSLHNYCPIRWAYACAGFAGLLLLASLDEQERSLAIKYTNLPLILLVG